MRVRGIFRPSKVRSRPSTIQFPAPLKRGQQNRPKAPSHNTSNLSPRTTHFPPHPNFFRWESGLFKYSTGELPAPKSLKHLLDVDGFALKIYSSRPLSWETCQHIRGLPDFELWSGKSSLESNLGYLARITRKTLSLDGGIVDVIFQVFHHKASGRTLGSERDWNLQYQLHRAQLDKEVSKPFVTFGFSALDVDKMCETLGPRLRGSWLRVRLEVQPPQPYPVASLESSESPHKDGQSQQNAIPDVVKGLRRATAQSVTGGEFANPMDLLRSAKHGLLAYFQTSLSNAGIDFHTLEIALVAASHRHRFVSSTLLNADGSERLDRTPAGLVSQSVHALDANAQTSTGVSNTLMSASNIIPPSNRHNANVRNGGSMAVEVQEEARTSHHALSQRTKLKTGIESVHVTIRPRPGRHRRTDDVNDVDIVHTFNRMCLETHENGLASSAVAMSLLAHEHPHLQVTLQTNPVKLSLFNAYQAYKGFSTGHVIFKINDPKDTADLSLYLSQLPAMQAKLAQHSDSAVSITGMKIGFNWRASEAKRLQLLEGHTLSVLEELGVFAKACYKAVEKIFHQATFESYSAIPTMLAEVILRSVPSPSPCVEIYTVKVTINPVNGRPSLFSSVASWVQEDEHDVIRQEVGDSRVLSDRRAQSDATLDDANNLVVEDEHKATAISATGQLAMLDRPVARDRVSNLTAVGEQHSVPEAVPGVGHDTETLTQDTQDFPLPDSTDLEAANTQPTESVPSQFNAQDMHSTSLQLLKPRALDQQYSNASVLDIQALSAEPSEGQRLEEKSVEVEPSGIQSQRLEPPDTANSVLESLEQISKVKVPESKSWHDRVFIALGSNVGDRLANIESACREMDAEEGIQVVRTSGLYETAPMYVTDQEPFLNGACEIKTTLQPIELLDRLQSIEKRLGRVKTVAKGPRNIDLDILLYGEVRVETDRLTIPHPLMLERDFVLRPLSDISKLRTHHIDLLGSSVLESLRKVPESQVPMLALTPLGPESQNLRAKDPNRPTHIMSILNTTPDSFSDGGNHNLNDVESLRTVVRSHIAAGATIIDVGGQSSRPNAPNVSAEQEIARVLPAIEAIKSLPEAKSVAISVDTYRADVAEAAVRAGAHIINDISAGRLDPDMLSTVARLGCTYIMMHMRGTPATMQNEENRAYPKGLLKTIADELRERTVEAQDAGIRFWRIILDPGIGFSKDQAQNLEILSRLPQLRRKLPISPWLVGSSRKSFIGKVTGVQKPADRVWGTAATVTASVRGGASVVRVHDVEEMATVVKMADAIFRS